MGKTVRHGIGAFGLVYLMVSLLVISCSSMKGVFKRVDLTKVDLGMSKREVIAALEKEPANIVAAKQYEDGTMEVLEYHDYMTNSAHDNYEIYWLYFFNDRLVEWGKPPLDWEVYIESGCTNSDADQNSADWRMSLHKRVTTFWMNHKPVYIYAVYA